MQIAFGKHAGKDSRAVFIKDPAYVAWARAEASSGSQLAALVKVFDRHIAKLDAAPFTARCWGKRPQSCTRPVVKGSAYVGSMNTLGRGVMWWCDQCNMYSEGALPGYLREVRSYADFQTLHSTYGSTKAERARAIAQLASAKGLTGALTQKNLDAFFGR